MPVLQNRCKAWQKIFDRWCHLVHTYWSQRGVFSFTMPYFFVEQRCNQCTNVPITFTIAFRAPSMLPSTSGYSSPKYSYKTTPKCPISFSYSQVKIIHKLAGGWFSPPHYYDFVKHWGPGACPEKSNWADEGFGGQEAAESSGCIAGEENAERRPHCSLTLLKGCYCEAGAGPFSQVNNKRKWA